MALQKTINGKTYHKVIEIADKRTEHRVKVVIGSYTDLASKEDGEFPSKSVICFPWDDGNDIVEYPLEDLENLTSNHIALIYDSIKRVPFWSDAEDI
jgi:hypothetical protein